jgi:hypothetical protein
MVQSIPSENLDSERLLSEWRWLCPQALTAIDRNAFVACPEQTPGAAR